MIIDSLLWPSSCRKSSVREHPATNPAQTDLVAQLVFEHAGRRVTPHIFRDIFAYAWLDDHPEDFLTLSKILWHQSINTTLRVMAGTSTSPMECAALMSGWPVGPDNERE
jgi:integrase